MYEHRTLHVVGDDDNAENQTQQLAEFADLMESQVSLLGHINSRIFQLSSPDSEALEKSKRALNAVAEKLEARDISIGSRELTMQNLVESGRLMADAVGADCISMAIEDKTGRLSGYQKKLATTAEQNVLLLREAGTLPPTSIVCPIDGSPASAKGLRQAVMMAFAWEAQLKVVSVLGTPRLFASPKFGVDYPVSYDQIEAHTEKEKQHMAGFIDRHLATTENVEIHYLNGISASEGILSFAATDSSALLVLGVAARDRFSSAVLGNTSYKVATKAANSTLLVRNNTY